LQILGTRLDEMAHVGVLSVHTPTYRDQRQFLPSFPFCTRCARYQSCKPYEYTFLYPADWKAREIVEEGYTDTYIAGPRNRAGTYSTSFAVGVTRAAGRTPTEAATVLLSKLRPGFSIQELGPFPATVAGAPAVEVEIAYWMPLPLNSIHPQRTVIRERNIFFQRGDRLYELRYAASEEDYETWLGTFRALVESFAFQEKPTDMLSYRAVATAVPQPVREESPGYEAEGNQNDGEPEHNQS